MDLAEQLKQQAIAQGFAVAGVAATAGSERLALRNAALERWLAAGYQADMAWMNNPKRRQVEQLLPGVRSLLAVGLNYYVEQQQQVGVATFGCDGGCIAADRHECGNGKGQQVHAQHDVNAESRHQTDQGLVG